MKDDVWISIVEWSCPFLWPWDNVEILNSPYLQPERHSSIAPGTFLLSCLFSDPFLKLFAWWIIELANDINTLHRILRGRCLNPRRCIPWVSSNGQPLVLWRSQAVHPGAQPKISGTGDGRTDINTAVLSFPTSSLHRITVTYTSFGTGMCFSILPQRMDRSLRCLHDRDNSPPRSSLWSDFFFVLLLNLSIWWVVPLRHIFSGGCLGGPIQKDF